MLPSASTASFSSGLTAGEPTVTQLGAGRIDEPREREAAHLADVERLGHRERPVDELVLRCDQLDRDLLRRERLQRERGLEPGNSGSRDDDVSAAVFHCARCFTPCRRVASETTTDFGISSARPYVVRAHSVLGSVVHPDAVPPRRGDYRRMAYAEDAPTISLSPSRRRPSAMR